MLAYKGALALPRNTLNTPLQQGASRGLCRVSNVSWEFTHARAIVSCPLRAVLRSICTFPMGFWSERMLHIQLFRRKRQVLYHSDICQRWAQIKYLHQTPSGRGEFGSSSRVQSELCSWTLSLYWIKPKKLVLTTLNVGCFEFRLESLDQKSIPQNPFLLLREKT